MKKTKVIWFVGGVAVAVAAVFALRKAREKGINIPGPLEQWA